MWVGWVGGREGKVCFLRDTYNFNINCERSSAKQRPLGSDVLTLLTV
jgi:hypothetical protein